MIPPFNETGVLPPGVHAATLAEIEARFGVQSELRRVQMESIRWMVELAIKAGVQRIVLNGSFVTDIIEPNDVDCVLLIARGFPSDPLAESELDSGISFLDIAFARQTDFDDFIGNVFSEDRYGSPKGMIEVIPWVS
jgi:hypothetical protein